MYKKHKKNNLEYKLPLLLNVLLIYSYKCYVFGYIVEILTAH